MTRNLYALLVGIDEYPNDGDKLNGCVNDIEAVEKFLENRLNYNPRIEKLLDKQATRQAVINKFENHLCQSGKDDVVLFYFCGHGSQEQAGLEFDALEYEKEVGKKKLETIVCYDSRTKGEDGTEIRDLADKELRYLIAKVAKNEPHILVVFDCCHSSSGTRDTDRKERVRRLPTDTRPPRAYNEFCFARDSAIAQNLKQGIFSEGKHVFMSACLHTETAKEIDDEDDKGRGVFSYFLLKELNSLNAALSYNDLLNEVKGYVHGRRRDQTPQIEPIGMSSQDLNSIAFLGDREVIKPREPYFNLIYRHKIQDRQSAEWIVTGGVSQFLQEGSELAVYPQNCTLDEMKDKSRKLGNVRITAVRMEESAVTFISEPEPPTDSSYKAVLTKRPLPTVRFYLEGDAAALAQVKEKLADSLVVGIERDRNKPHQYRLYAREQRFEITDANDRLLVVPIQANGEYDVNKAVKQVEHIARWTKTRQLENPNSSILKDAIEIEITHNGKVYTNSDLQIEHGSTIRLKLKNTRNQPLYCAILDVADNYEVSLLRFFPEGGDRTWICLYPGQTYQAQALSETGFIEEIPFGMPDEVINQGLTEYQEVLKLIVSTEAFTTLSQFEQNSLSLADQKSRQPLTAPPVTGWMTKQITLTTVQADSVELTPQTEKVVSAGVQVIAPPGLQATARLKPPSSTTRSVSSIGLPALLDNTEAFQFSTSRSVRQNASVLELEVNPSTLDAVKPDSPMVISVDRPLQPNERVLAVAHDGQFYFPLGVGQAENGKTEIKIERLCDPQRLNADERELRQAIQLCFRKVVLDNVGQKSSSAWLRKATVNGDGTVSYTKKGDMDTVKAAVAKAKNIVLYIHGIIGDTESMIPSVRYAKVNANGQAKSLEELYDLVLAFDYESLNTSIEDTARELKRQLAAVGLEPNHGKTLHILAHSMGGLVSRSFIEQGNGNEVVSHLIMVGTPNGGSPWATVHDLATTLLSFGLNLSSVPIVPSLLEKLVEAMSVTLREMHATKSSFLDELKAFVDPKCPYSIIAGSTALMDRASEVKQLLDALKQKMRRAIEFPFGDEENDIAVAVTSIIDVPKDRSPAVYTPTPIACDHLSYFRQTEGLHAIASVVGRAFGYPPDTLPPTRPSAPQGPQPNPVSPSPSSDPGTQSMRSTKGIPAEPASNPNSSGDGNGSVNANASASTSGAVDTNESVPLQPRHSETVIASEPQVISPPSSQTEPIPSPKASPTPAQPQPNHATRTTTWFTKSHIIAIGIDEYKFGIESLDNAVSDAEKIAEIFERQGFEKHLLLGEKDKPHLVNRDEVRKLLTNLKNTVGENDRLIFYYAGHGIALPSQDSSEPEANSQSSTNGKPETKPRNKPQGYLILQEAEQNKPKTYLPMDDLIQWLSAISCRHYLMILDCCYAGAIQWSFGRTRQVLLPKIFPSLLDTFIDSPAWQILTSSDEDQPANDGLILDLSLQKNNRVSQDQTSSNSPFVCFLEQALVEGKAQIPESQIVTTTELSSYLLRMVGLSTSQAGKRQTPRLFTLPEKHKRGEFVFLLDTFEKVKKHLKEKFPDPKIDDEHNPYRGLQSYTDNDGDVFFGRKRLIEDLSEYVQTHLFTVVLGTSGVGKSSLVNAGLVPKLKETSKEAEPPQSSNSEEKTTQQPESEPKVPPVKWDNYAIFRPGQLPATALEEALKKLEPSNIPDNTKRLLVIDQFEEVETQCRDEEQKKKFWNQLIAQLNNTSNKLHFVVTLRSDFESTLRSKFKEAINKFGTENDKSKIKGHSKVESTNLPKSTNEQFKFPINWVAARFIVPAMKLEELQDVIEKTAEEKAVFFTLEQKLKDGTERTLVQQLVNEVAGMPGSLPLLSFALYTMYRNFAQRYVDAEKARDLIKREITWEDYNSLGDNGVLGSLTRRADEEYKNLEYKLDKVEENDKSLLKVVKDEQGKAIKEEASITKARQEMLKWVMLRMVTLDDGQVARRRVLKKELKYDERYNRTKSEQLDLVIQLFDQARLLVQGNVEVFNEKVEGGQITEEVEEKEYVEPAHDALILNWEKLREWIKEDKGNIILRDRVIPDINDWQRLREAEKPSNWTQHLLNLLGTGIDRLVEQLRVKGELKRLNKQENTGQKQSVTASKNNYSSDENTKATAQETAEIASENLTSNQAITEEISSHLPENGHSLESNTTVTVQETVETASENLLSNQAITEEARPQAHSEGTQHPKSSDRLWDKEPRLEVLGQQLGKLQASEESWLNKTEADFVRHSLIKREKRRARRTTFLSAVGLVLLAATVWALNEQRNTLIEEIRTSRQSAESNLQANRDLEALTDILRARKTFDRWLIRLPFIKGGFPIFSPDIRFRRKIGNVEIVNIPLGIKVGNSEVEQAQVRGTLYKAIYATKERNRFQLDRGVIRSVALHPTEDLLAITSNHNTIRLYDSAGNPKMSFPADHNVSSLAFTPDGKWLVAGGDNTIKFWEIEVRGDKSIALHVKKEEPVKSKSHVYRVIDIAFPPNNNQKATDSDSVDYKVRMATVSDDYKVQIWQLQIPKEKKNLKLTFEQANFEPQDKIKFEQQIYRVAFRSANKKEQQNQIVTVGNSDEITINLLNTTNNKFTPIKTINTEQTNVHSVAFTHDGKLATGGEDKTVKFWEIKEEKDQKGQSKTEIKPFSPPLKGEKIFTTPPNIIYGMAFGANGKLAIFGEDDKVTLLDDSGKTIDTIQPQDTYVNDAIAGNMAYSPDGSKVAVIAGGNTIRLWDIKSGKQLRRFSIPPKAYGDAISLAFSPNGEEFVMGTKNGYITLWNIYGELLDEVSPDKMPSEWIVKYTDPNTKSQKVKYPVIQRIMFSPDGAKLGVFAKNSESLLLGTCSVEKETLRNLEPFAEEKESGIKDFAINSQFNRVLFIISNNKNDNSVYLWDKNKPNNPKGENPPPIQTKVNSVAFSPNNESFATAGENGDVKVWNVENLKKPFLEFPTHQKNIESIVFDPQDSNSLLTGGEDGTVRLWDISGNKPTQLSAQGQKLALVALSSDKKLLAVKTKKAKLLMWEWKEGSGFKQKDISGTNLAQGMYTYIAFMPKSHRLVTVEKVDKDFNVKLWDSEGKNFVQLDKNKTTQQKVSWVTWSEDGKVIATVGGDEDKKTETVKLWDFQDDKFQPRNLENIQLENFKNTSIALSFDANKLATTQSSPLGRVNLWDTSKGKKGNKIREFQTQQGTINSIAFSPNGERLVTVGENQPGKRTLRLWDVFGNQLALIQEDEIDRAKFSPDGRLLAGVRKNDGQLMVWDVSGDKFNPLYGQKSDQKFGVTAFEFNANGQLATVGEDGQDSKVSLWQIDEKQLLAQACNFVRAYLDNNPNVAQRDRHLCEDIPPSTQSPQTTIANSPAPSIVQPTVQNAPSPAPSSNNRQDTPSSSAPANAPARPQNVPSPTPSSNNRQDTPSSSAPSKIQARPRNVPSPTPTSNNGQHSYEQARSDRRQASKLNSTSVDAYINQGLTYHRQRNYQQAISSYSKAIALNPNSAKAYSNRAAAYNEQKDYQKVIADSSKAIRLNPNYVNAYINRGLAYYHQDKYQQAIANYNKAIELDPNNANAYHNRALAYTRLGNQQAAQANQRKAAALSQRQSQ